MRSNYTLWQFDLNAPITGEYLIAQLNANIISNARDRLDLAELAKSAVWTTKQAENAIRLISKYQKHISNSTNLHGWITTPVFTKPPYDFEIYLNQNSIYVRDGVAFFNSKYNAELIKDIKDIRCSIYDKKVYARWNSDNKTWSIPITDGNVCNIFNIGEKYNLKIDQEIVDRASVIAEKIIEDKTLLTLNDGRHITLAGDTIVIAITDIEIMEKIKNEFGINDT